MASSAGASIRSCHVGVSPENATPSAPWAAAHSSVCDRRQIEREQAVVVEADTPAPRGRLAVHRTVTIAQSSRMIDADQRPGAEEADVVAAGGLQDLPVPAAEDLVRVELARVCAGGLEGGGLAPRGVGCTGVCILAKNRSSAVLRLRAREPREHDEREEREERVEVEPRGHQLRLRPAREVDAEPAHHPQLGVEAPAAFLGRVRVARIHRARPARRRCRWAARSATGRRVRRRARPGRPPRRRAWRAPWTDDLPRRGLQRATPGGGARRRCPGRPSGWPRRGGCRWPPAR